MRAYNVGSEHEVSINKLANEVVNCTNKEAQVVVKGIDTSENVTRYVPSIERIRKETGFAQSVPLQQALLRTLTWLKEMEIK